MWRYWKCPECGEIQRRNKSYSQCYSLRCMGCHKLVELDKVIPMRHISKAPYYIEYPEAQVKAWRGAIAQKLGILNNSAEST